MSNPTSNGIKLPVLGNDEPIILPTRKGMSRRGFLQVLGATSVATLASACARPTQDTLSPYVSTPDDVVPGNALHYATAMCVNGLATGLVVTAFEGRPTKIEGNPRHPWSVGGTTAWQQSSILDLYDPARARDIMHRGTATSREALVAALREQAAQLDKTQGQGLRLLLEPSSSPLLASRLEEIKKRWPKAVTRFYSAGITDASTAGAALAFGKPLTARYDFKKADVVVSLDSDFLAFDAGSRYTMDFAERRSDPENLSRFYAIECDLTLTGSNADHRFPMKSGDVGAAARALYAKLGGAGVDGTAPAALGDKALAAIANDLQAHKGKSLVVVGERQPAAVHAIGHAINALLGNAGQTVVYAASALIDPVAGPAALKALCDEANAGQVELLLCNANNPAFAKPNDLDVAGAFGKVKNLLYTSLRQDQTSPLAAWFVPAAHYLESWGDARSADGTVSVVQPLISPIWNGLTFEEILSALLDPSMLSSHDQIRARYSKASANPDADWAELLKTGFVDNSTIAPEDAAVNQAAVANAARALTGATGGVELNLRYDYKVLDGRFGHNPWLLELPDPVTKLVWDNAALMSPKTAEKLNVEREFVVSVAAAGKTVEIPVYVVPGHADDAVTLSLGWGLPDAKDVVVNEDPTLLGYDEDHIGVDGWQFSTLAAPFIIADAKLSVVDKRYPMAVTQGSFDQHGRFIAMEVDVNESTAERKKEREEKLELLGDLRGEKLPTLYDPYPYEGFKWGMAVDLSRCTGCSACVVACVSENNIPMVGKDGVRRGREMHWLRIDRYYEGSDANPRVVNQPMACVHCDNAPCEYVCPVNATVHSDEGLNEMVYNRCIGTRYCSNNCPYKVRRFNFFAYNNDIPAVVQLSKNPDVTVRPRGVMEKCTYCVQRIEQARIKSEINGVTDDAGKPMIRVLGTEAPKDPKLLERAERVPMLQSACQQACPTGAIVFGNLNDKNAIVAKMHADARRFDALNSLGTRPRTGYLARLTNRNPELA